MKTEDEEWTSGAYGLTLRGLKILELIAEGKTREEIADRLNISIHTVDRHLTSVYQKLGVKNGSQAVAKWFRSRFPSGMPNVFC
ncbi:MAG: helix-turn-helix transcriptional regulator [Bacteroidetes bacterium]|nr:helix-turn-helix transcriptional regulator [Bacteroidota bacterium]